MIIFTHRLGVSISQFKFWWWRHDRLTLMSQWPDNWDTIIWKVISNLLDIDFIHGDIHEKDHNGHPISNPYECAMEYFLYFREKLLYTYTFFCYLWFYVCLFLFWHNSTTLVITIHAMLSSANYSNIPSISSTSITTQPLPKGS